MKKFLPLIGLAALLVILISVMIVSADNETVDFSGAPQFKGKCNVGVASIVGYLDTQRTEDHVDSLSISQGIRSLALDDYAAIVLLIDSEGGYPPAAEEISRAIDDIELPIAAFVRGYALSGGYWIAASAEHIVALETATIGNIGVTSSYLDEIGYNAKEGYAFQEIVSGEYKEVGNKDKPLTVEHRVYLQEYTNDLFFLFMDVVRKNRGLTDAQVSLVSQGKFYVAGKAKELGLIDDIGGITELKAYLSGRTNLETDELLFCEPTTFE